MAATLENSSRSTPTLDVYVDTRNRLFGTIEEASGCADYDLCGAGRAIVLVAAPDTTKRQLICLG
jgi:hypothetical protein